MKGAVMRWMLLSAGSSFRGVSTRRLRVIARELFGHEVSAATVTKTAGYLDKELQHYQSSVGNLDR